MVPPKVPDECSFRKTDYMILPIYSVSGESITTAFMKLIQALQIFLFAN